MPLEPFSATWFGTAVTSALISVGCREGVLAGLGEVGKRLSLGKLDPNHDLTKAARPAQLNAAIYTTGLALEQARKNAVDPDPALRAAHRGPTPP